MTATLNTDVRALSIRFEELLNAHDLGPDFDALVLDDFVEENPLPGQGPGRSGLADILAIMGTGFPDIHWHREEDIVEGDRIFCQWTWTGTHRGEFLGIPATGREVAVEAWTKDTYRDGQLVRSRIIMDVAGLLVQLGVMPPPAV
ncbi:MAG: ester cyclase [Jatrophihabitans sp.]|uniref:ester cyclase n=1 Tax=Jatrophihabitans sp. TaxID=1932789 RepID=UPI003F7D77B8